MTLKNTVRTTLSCFIITGLVASGPAFAGTCDTYDFYTDSAINEADAITLSEAILVYSTGDVDYNNDGVVNVFDIVSSQHDARVDVRSFGRDVARCVTGGFDLNKDGVTNVLDVVQAKSAGQKVVISECVLGNGELDFNDDGTINVLDATRYAMVRNAEARGFAYAAVAEILGDISRLDTNDDGDVNVLDAVGMGHASSVCN